MNHENIYNLLDAYADGELDLLSTVEVDQHLNDCADCRARDRRTRSLRAALQKSGVTYRAPSALKRKLRATLRRETRERRGGSPFWLIFGASAIAALLMVAFALSWSGRASGNAIAQEVVSSHVRSLLATHLVDVASSNQHTVKPWFDGKVDYAPEVKDLASAGFPLVGGRLDYVADRAVVALVYRRQQHPINLFIWPAATERNLKPASLSFRGYNLVHWSARGMDYWAVSDLNAAELGAFAQSLSAEL